MTATTALETPARSAQSGILDLAHITAGDRHRVGNKASNLARLMDAGFPVPRGFCITADCLRQAVPDAEGAPLLPPPLRATLTRLWRHYGMALAAVRSSALDEDGTEASLAGLYTTVLNVGDEWSLLDAIEQCLESQQRRPAGSCRGMAVIVQEMVPARAAGVLFTVDPLGGDRHVHVNAVLGLGEPLASGSVTGDSFVVDRTGEIVRRTLSDKPVMLTTRGEILVAGDQRGAPALGADEVRALARLGLAVEARFGAPQDIEFALTEAGIQLLQSRPIPPAAMGLDSEAYLRRERNDLQGRIAASRAAGLLEAGEAVFSNGNIGELLPTPTPMSFGVFSDVFAGAHGAIATGRRSLGYRIDGRGATGLYELIGGQPYFNLEVDARTFDIGLPLNVDDYIRRVVEAPELAHYPEMGLYHQHLTQEKAHTLFGADAPGRLREARAFDGALRAHAADFLKRFPVEIEPRLTARHTGLPDHTATPVTALLSVVEGSIAHLRDVSCRHFVVAARLGFYFAASLRERLDEIGAGHLYARLLQGLSGSRITEQSLALERLAEGVITPDDFLAAYGHLASTELELSLPRLAEEPATLTALQHGLARSGRRPSEDFERQAGARRAAEDELRKLVPGAQEDGVLGAMRLAQAFLPLRETIKYHFTADLATVRYALLELGRRLGLADDDVFYLYPGELAEAERAGLHDRIAQRRRERQSALRLAREKRLPDVIFGSRLETIGRRPNLARSRTLSGTPIAPGSAVGIIRLLDGPDAAATLASLTGREILVARSANLGLAPLLRTVAGLIVEVGGVLAHAACQAREAGVPALVVENATVLLQEGQAVHLDCDRGEVAVLATDPAPLLH